MRTPGSKRLISLLRVTRLISAETGLEPRPASIWLPATPLLSPISININDCPFGGTCTFCCLVGGGVFLLVFCTVSYRRACFILCRTPASPAWNLSSPLSVCPRSDFPAGPGFAKSKSVLPSKASLWPGNQTSLLSAPPFSLRNLKANPLVSLVRKLRPRKRV